MQPVIVLEQVGFRVVDLFLVQEFAEVVHHVIVYIKTLAYLVGGHVTFGKVEERIVLQEFVLEAVGLLGRDLNVGSNPAAAIHSAAAIGEFNFAVDAVLFGVTVVVVVVERHAGVVALDKAPARGVVLGGG